MDCNTGEIFQMTEADMKEFERERPRPLSPLTQRQYTELEPMGAPQRKGYMRNQPCVCGSGKKFKKCCWSKYA